MKSFATPAIIPHKKLAKNTNDLTAPSITGVIMLSNTSTTISPKKTRTFIIGCKLVSAHTDKRENHCIATFTHEAITLKKLLNIFQTTSTRGLIVSKNEDALACSHQKAHQSTDALSDAVVAHVHNHVNNHAIFDISVHNGARKVKSLDIPDTSQLNTGKRNIPICVPNCVS